MAVIIRRDNQSVDFSSDSPFNRAKKNTSLDTILLYIVGFLGLVGSIYLLHLSNQNKALSQPIKTNTSYYINLQKLNSSHEYRSLKENHKIIPATYLPPPKKG